MSRPPQTTDEIQEICESQGVSVAYYHELCNEILEEEECLKKEIGERLGLTSDLTRAYALHFEALNFLPDNKIWTKLHDIDKLSIEDQARYFASSDWYIM